MAKMNFRFRDNNIYTKFKTKCESLSMSMNKYLNVLIHRDLKRGKVHVDREQKFEMGSGYKSVRLNVQDSERKLWALCEKLEDRKLSQIVVDAMREYCRERGLYEVYDD